MGKKNDDNEMHKGEKSMTTQIAATPILYGEEARKAMKEAKTIQSKKAQENAKKIMSFFNQFSKEGK